MRRPLWSEYPEDAATFAEQVTFLLGSDILVAPAVRAGQTLVDVYFPGSSIWVDTQSQQVQISFWGEKEGRQGKKEWKERIFPP